MKKLAWLIYINSKEKLLSGNENIQELAYILYAAIYWTIILAPSDVQSKLIDQLIENKDSKADDMNMNDQDD